MTATPFIGFLNNAALLLALGLIYSVLHRRVDTWQWHVVRGIMLGIVAIGVMVNPWQLSPGIIFDTRPIVLSVGGMFLGFIPTIIAAVMASLYRIYIGGAGALTGTLWVVVSAVWGLAWLRWRKRSAWELLGRDYYLLGFSLSVVLLLLMFTMPDEMAMPILSNIGLPVIIIFPIATVLLAKLFTVYDLKVQSQRLIEESERKYRELVEQARVILLRVDLQGQVTFINDYGQSIFGYRADELVGNHVVGTIVPETDGAGHDLAQFVDNLLTAPEEYHEIENDNICKDGRRITVAWKNTPLRNEQGAYIGVQSVGHDLTEQKRLQAQSIRSAQLASLGELSAGVAHEINNPISGVINYALILKSRIDAHDHQHILDRIVREGERIAKIVKALLSFARDDKSEFKRHNIRTVLNNPLSLIKAQLEYDCIAVTTTIADGPQELYCNSHQIEQIILNLLSNSRHALNEKFPKGSSDKKIDIEVSHLKVDGGYLRIDFTDNGTGIPEDVLPRILNPFFTTKEAGVGTGLGLSICQDIINLHQGTFDVESTEGEYARFSIELPCNAG